MSRLQVFEGYVGDTNYVWDFGTLLFHLHFNAAGELIAASNSDPRDDFDRIVKRERVENTTAIKREPTGWWVKENRA